MIMLDPQRIFAAGTGPCEHIVEHAHAWVDGELTSEAAAELRAHVTACPACARVLEVESRFLHAVKRRARLDAAPASLHDRVRSLPGTRG